MGIEQPNRHAEVITLPPTVNLYNISIRPRERENSTEDVVVTQPRGHISVEVPFTPPGEKPIRYRHWVEYRVMVTTAGEEDRDLVGKSFVVYLRH